MLLLSLVTKGSITGYLLWLPLASPSQAAEIHFKFYDPIFGGY